LSDETQVKQELFRVRDVVDGYLKQDDVRDIERLRLAFNRLDETIELRREREPAPSGKTDGSTSQLKGDTDHERNI